MRIWSALLGVTLFASASAMADGITGKYQGTVGSVDGYAGKVGDACAVAIEAVDKFGGALSFKIDEMEPYVIEEKKVTAAMTGPETKIVSRMTEGVEVLVFKRNDAGVVESVKIIRKRPQIQSEQSIGCGSLKKL